MDFGTPAAREFLIAGFPELAAEGRAVPTVARRLSVRIEATWPRDARIGVEARSAAGSGAALTVLLNGAALGKIDIGRRWTRAEVEAPADAWLQGSNALELTVSEPAGDPLPGILWDKLTVDWRPALPDAAIAEVRPDHGELAIPFGTRIDYHHRGGDGLRLDIEKLRASGAAGRLRVEAFDDASGAAAVWRQELDAAARPAEVHLPLPSTGAGFLRLSLTALPADAAGGEGGSVLLAGARLQATAPPAIDAAIVPAGVPGPPGRPSMLLFLVDTLRADRLGAYGSTRGLTPNIDRFARGATVLSRTVAQSSWTKASMASVFTGLYPSAHGVAEHDSVLIDDAVTLAEMLAAAEYETAGVVAISTVASLFGFAQGFETYEELLEEPSPGVHQPAERIVDAGLRWLDGRSQPQRPFFVYLHVADPHTPYVPPDDLRKRFAPGVDPMDLGNFMTDLRDWQPSDAEVAALTASASALYDAEVAYVDRQFGRLLDGLEARGLLQDTVVMLLADHGEEFYDHGGFTHGHTLYQEQLHVPWIVSLPGGLGAGARLDDIVRQVDVLPTMLQLAGVAAPANLQGASILPLLRSAAPPRQALSQLRLGDLQIDSVVEGDWKLLRALPPGASAQTFELFDLSIDPGERKDLAASRPVARGFFAEQLAAGMSATLASALDVENAVLSPEVTERLRALGYIR